MAYTVKVFHFDGLKLDGNESSCNLAARFPRSIPRKRVIVLKRCLSLVNHNYSNCVLYCNEILLLLIFKPNCPHLHLKKKTTPSLHRAPIRSDPFRTLHHRNITRGAKYVTLFHCQQQHPKKPHRETVSFHKQQLSQKSKLSRILSRFEVVATSRRSNTHPKKKRIITPMLDRLKGSST